MKIKQVTITGKRISDECDSKTILIFKRVWYCYGYNEV